LNGKLYRGDILKITWEQILDTLWEYKSIWSLGNMYIIQYRQLDNQSQKDVEYIGISKLHASFLIDDTIRDVINTNVKVQEKGDKQYVWVLEEFIKNKPLLHTFYKNLKLYFSGKIKYLPKKTSLIYSASLDKNILELGKNKSEFFSDEFFSRYKKIVTRVKAYAGKLFLISRDINSTFSNFSQEKKQNFAFIMFGYMRKNSKYAFVNTLLKELNQTDSKNHVDKIIRFLFEDILNDDKTWQHNAIAIISGLIYKGDDYGESENNQ
jgi:CRISPR-associated protein Cst1